ncbi:general stress protein [Aliicoccus persicus]|uniref:Heat induced stress protein YflT n=1 Tax=Aliicoccus persicus TaxID=930138 RepID=A0A662Z2K2_9STAP|nr:general stress protein [Aliicoccus persicus]SEV94385.1 Heat induced stress protein YflT [Aliicoccus persicus]
MNKFERFSSEQQVLKHLEDILGHGVNEEDVTIVSKSRLVELSSRYPNVTYKDSEGGIMEKISSLFTDELPEDKVLNSLDLTEEERETCRQAIDQEDIIVFNASHDFDGALDGEHYDMSKDDHTDGVVDTDKKSATLAGAQFGSHDAGREPMFNNEDEVDENVGNEGTLDQREASDNDFFDEQNKVDTDEGSLPEHKTHRLNDEEYLRETKNAEGLKTGNKEEGMDTDNERNKEFAFGKDNPRDDVSELDKDEDDVDEDDRFDSVDNTEGFNEENTQNLDDEFETETEQEPVNNFTGENNNTINDHSEPVDDINDAFNEEDPNNIDNDFERELDEEPIERFTDRENNDPAADYNQPVDDNTDVLGEDRSNGLDNDFKTEPVDEPIDDFIEKDKNPDDDYNQPLEDPEDDRVRQEVTNDAIHEQNLENKGVAEDFDNQARTEDSIDNAEMKDETIARDIEIERSGNVERRTVNADRERNDSVDAWDIPQEDKGPYNNLDDVEAPSTDDKYEDYRDEDQILREDKDLDEEEASREALNQSNDLDFDDEGNREKRSNRLDDTLRADEAREDAFDHDKGRF